MNKSIPFVNIIALIAVLVVNALANALPINGYNTGELSNMYPNKFVPSGVTFSIWGLIYLCLIGWVGYYAIKRKDYHKTGIGYWFIINCLLNISWILVWHYKIVWLSVLIMLSLLYTLIKMYLALRQSGLSQWHIIPFSIYLGWICVATIANTTTLLVDLGINGGSAAPYISSIMIVVAIALAMYFMFVKKDIGIAMVVAWAIYGIYSRHDDLPIQVVTIVGMLCLGLLILITFSRQNAIIQVTK